MSKKQDGFIFVILLIVLAIGLIALFFSPINSLKSQKESPNTNTQSIPNVKIKNDINRDGKVDIIDVNLVKSSMGCKKDDPCWSKVIGKTSDGDNPIYTSDLDSNTDGIVDIKDMFEIPSQN